MRKKLISKIVLSILAASLITFCDKTPLENNIISVAKANENTVEITVYDEFLNGPNRGLVEREVRKYNIGEQYRYEPLDEKVLPEGYILETPVQSGTATEDNVISFQYTYDPESYKIDHYSPTYHQLLEEQNASDSKSSSGSKSSSSDNANSANGNKSSSGSKSTSSDNADSANGNKSGSGSKSSSSSDADSASGSNSSSGSKSSLSDNTDTNGEEISESNNNSATNNDNSSNASSDNPNSETDDTTSDNSDAGLTGNPSDSETVAVDSDSTATATTEIKKNAPVSTGKSSSGTTAKAPKTGDKIIRVAICFVLGAAALCAGLFFAGFKRKKRTR